LALLIDTSLLIALERDDAAIETLGDEERAISVVTVSELLHGVHRARGAQQTRRRAVVEAILAAFDAIPVTEPVARIHAEIWARLSARGSVIGNHDLWIAATALTHGFGVATRNAGDFKRVPGLRVLDFVI
jgi:tRNA(fMet)-specific endonuclease VapC